jgi:hypothetical protein
MILATREEPSGRSIYRRTFNRAVVATFVGE